VRAVPVDRIVSSLRDDHPLFEVAAGVPAQRCEAGQRWTRDGVDFTVLHPAAEGYADARAKTNDLSCVVRVDAGATRVLIAGDIEARSESRLVRVSRDALAAQALVVPHHGSRTSSTPAFVAAVDPAIAIFTPGYRNRFGHPRPDVVARYVARDVRTLRTDLDGAVAFDVAPEGLAEVERTRVAFARYWREAPRAAARLGP
jgi:competence protein ComEC